MANRIVRVKSWQEEHGDYRCGGIVTEHEKYYVCGNCKGTVGKSDKFCSKCGEPLKGIEDNKKEEIKKKIAKYKREKTKLVKSVTPENFNSVTKQVKVIDKKLEICEDGLVAWENYSSGDLPWQLSEID